MTEWPEFAALNLADVAGRMNSAVLIDGRNLFDPEKARKAASSTPALDETGARSRSAASGPRNKLRGGALRAPAARRRVMRLSLRAR